MNRLHWLVGEASGASDGSLIPGVCEAIEQWLQSISHNAMADR